MLKPMGYMMTMNLTVMISVLGNADGMKRKKTLPFRPAVFGPVDAQALPKKSRPRVRFYRS